MSKSPLDALSELDRFYHIFGKALAQWAELEFYLSILFKFASGLDFKPAEDIFYSGRSFQARADILTAALGHAPLDPQWREFIEGVLAKAIAYNNFRNQLAHGTVHPNELDDKGEPRDWRLKKAEKWLEQAGATASDLATAATNFDRLGVLISEAVLDIERGKPPTGYLERLAQLPSEAGASQPSRKQLGRLRQQQASLRKSKRRSLGK